MPKSIAVIGGGAAGFFAALSAKSANPNCQVYILERSAKVLAKVSRNLGAPMTGIGMDQINERYAERGW